MFVIDLGLGKKIVNHVDYVYNELQSDWPERRMIFLDVSGDWKEIITDCDPDIKPISYPITPCFSYSVSYKGYTPDLPKNSNVIR